VTAGLTPAQHKLRDYIAGYIGDRGYSPTYREIAEYLGLKSKSGVHRHVHGLIKRGAVTVLPGAARALAVEAGYRVILDPTDRRSDAPSLRPHRHPIERLIAIAADAYLQLVPDDQPGHRAEAEEWR
jgi:SOS-response transcriptional repressor LexA